MAYDASTVLGVKGPSDDPDDPVSHGPGEPRSVRREVHTPRLTARPPLQRRRAPGLQLQDETRVGRYVNIEYGGTNAKTFILFMD